MQAERPVVPEFDRNRLDTETGPVRRPRNVAYGIAGGVFGNGFFQRKTAFERAGLFRGPGADPAAARARRVIGVGFRIGDDLNLAAQPHLASEGLPVEAHSRLRSEEHTSELQSLMRNSYAVFLLIQQTET